MEEKEKKIYETDGRDRVLLVLTLGLAIFMADLLLLSGREYLGAGLTALILAWEGVMLWYAGGFSKLRSWEHGLLTVAIVLLAACFTLFSNRWFWAWNKWAVLGLMVVQMFGLFGQVAFPWYRPFMLLERLMLAVTGLAGRLPAAFHAVSGGRASGKRMWYVVGGLAVALPLLLVAGVLLLSADALFRQTMVGFLSGPKDVSSLVGRVLLGLILTPFLFGLLYSLRRNVNSGLKPEDLPTGVLKGDPALPATVLGALNSLYFCFAAVQFRGLFGGAAYIEAMGISYADYARSGFFQLVWVSALNLVVVLAAVQFSRREGKLWKGVQVLSTVMVALTGVMLVSAAGRMTLYVTEYGLSFKRLLTYWGMVMLAVFFAAALVKIWARQFAFFRVLFTASIAGWLVLNFINVDKLVAGYNVSLYRTGNSAVMDLPYLGYLSYDALSYLEELDGSMNVYYDAPSWELSDYTLEMLLRDRKATAALECQDWRTWTASAYLVAVRERKE